jgi:hypothetical protein
MSTDARQPMSDVNGHVCTRGGCGMVLGSFTDQEEHNLTVHLKDKKHEGDPFKGISNAYGDDEKPF